MYLSSSFADARSGFTWSPILRKTALVVLVSGALTILGGCCREPFPLIPVTGRVTYTDRSLIPGKAIMIRFVPVDRRIAGKDVAGAATGYLNPQDGTFPGLTTHRGLDGVAPGRSKVTLSNIDLGPNSTTPADAIPRRYQDPQLTPLEVEVSASNRHFELRLEKPR